MTRALSILLLVAALAFAIGPLATPGFNGFTADQFPIPQIDPPAQPAGYAFAIWGVIYLWLIVGAGFQLLMRHDAPDWAPMRVPLIVSLVLGAAWLGVAQMSPFWATVLIWLMWGGAVLALMRAPRRDCWFGHGPIGLYAGWLTAASSVALALMLAGHGIMGARLAAIVVLLLALGLAVTITRARPDAQSFPAGVVWALIGVIVANAQGGSTLVLLLAAFGAAGLSWLTLTHARRT
ncbi:hypothetical protein PGB28_01145 [Primorskyibacter aestuariivivens]|uniref:hypothetical protein n=1 Tax=Primorskyibacter aestuariivivens TaxID=1888912 RepID=UPI002300EE85|nr:hypothetical protein [Primorskyibacter aestuariivivens]MDA7427046.1 hypothetical protein [Primorskyibacter aestuariivivens]